MGFVIFWMSFYETHVGAMGVVLFSKLNRKILKLEKEGGAKSTRK